MNDTPTSHLEILKVWGWYCPKERLAPVLHAQLRQALPEDDLLSIEMVAYHQDRDHVLLRRRGEPTRVMVVHLSSNPVWKRIFKRWPVVFDGTFSEFAAREQERHEIEQRMIEQPNDIAGICPVCFAAVADEGCCGIWTGSLKSKAHNGPLHSATCKSCRSLLIAGPTHEDAKAGVFLWEFSEWGDDAA